MSDYQDYTVLTIYLTLGIPLLISYYLLSTKSKNTLTEYWTNHGRVKFLKNYKKLYIASILIAAISGIYLMYYFTWGNNGNGISQNKIFDLSYQQGSKYFIYVGFLLLIGFSLLWIPSFRLADRLSGIVLMIVGAGAILIMSTIAYVVANNQLNTTEDKIALAAAVYLAFHTCILDGLLWSGKIK